MTVAIMMHTPEGVIFGADSATTVSLSGPNGPQVAQLFNSGQKIFEIGPANSRFEPGCCFSGAFVTWGGASLGPLSWRNIVSEFYCRVINNEAMDVTGVPTLFLQFIQQKWTELIQNNIFPVGTPIPDTGIGIAWINKGEYEVQASSIHIQNGSVSPINVGEIRTCAGHAAHDRIISGYDSRLKAALLKAGVDQTVFESAAKQFDISPFLAGMPLRDALDFVHFLAYSTIKLSRYKGGPPLVGGPIEIASITADRGFRWILHKPLSESIGIPRGGKELT